MRSWRFLTGVVGLGFGTTFLAISVHATTVLEKPRSLHPELRPALDDRIKGMMQRQHIPGMAIVVIKNGLVIERRGYGFADRKTQATVSADTAFPIGSITKQFTATAVMLLVEDDKLDLDTPIRQYLTDLPPTWQPLTLRQLLSHTSGLSEQYDYGKIKNPKDILKFGNPQLDFPPGETWSYSNTGYLVAGQIIEQVSGQSYHDFMRDRIFQPLGMSQTEAAVTPSLPNLATGYFWNDRGWNHQLDEDTLAGWQWADAAGNIISTATDMTKWVAALNTGKLLKPSSYAQLWNATPLKNGQRTIYGLGWFLGNFNQHPYTEHGGNIAGYSSGLFRFPDDRIDVMILTNTAVIDGSRIAQSIASVYDPSMSITSLKPQSDPDPALTQRFLKLLQGDQTSIPFSPEYKLLLKTKRGKYIQKFKPKYRTIKSLEFLQSEPVNADRSYYYKVTNPGPFEYAVITINANGEVTSYRATSPP
jgi:D-alanyl-D-alanine carboxypeptidase